MRSERIQDRLHWGWNITARAIGRPADAYRPTGPNDPLSPENRFLRLHAAFEPVSPRHLMTAASNEPTWRGIFDGAYTQPGDYLLQDGTVWFIATQRQLQPILCVETNYVISASRSMATDIAGTAPYGGANGSTPLCIRWPAAVMPNGTNSQSHANLPADTSASVWKVLLPPIPNVTLLPSDHLMDDRGTSYLVTEAETSKTVWRLTVQQVTT